MSSRAVAVSSPRYQILAEQLLHEIVDGQFEVGSYLPTEAELRHQYNVSRFTARGAIKILQDRGLVVTRRGVGTQVISNNISTEKYSFSSDSITNFLTNASLTHLVDITIEDAVSDEQLAKLMRCNVGQKMLRIGATRVVDEAGTKFAVARMEVFVLGRYSAVRRDIGEPRAISESIEQRFGVKTSEIQQRILPVLIDSDLAEQLQVPEGSPGLRVSRAYVDTDGEIFEYVIAHHAGKHAEITMNIRQRYGD